MEDRDLIIMDGADVVPKNVYERENAPLLRVMADTLRAMNERLTSLDRQVRLLTKVTPMQASEINAAIRARAKEICAVYRLQDADKVIIAAIRRDIRLMQGTRGMRDLPMCEYGVTLNQIALWDDYKVVRAARGKEGKRDG